MKKRAFSELNKRTIGLFFAASLGLYLLVQWLMPAELGIGVGARIATFVAGFALALGIWYFYRKARPIPVRRLPSEETGNGTARPTGGSQISDASVTNPPVRSEAV